MRNCACTHVQKKRHFYAKMTRSWEGEGPITHFKEGIRLINEKKDDLKNEDEPTACTTFCCEAFLSPSSWSWSWSNFCTENRLLGGNVQQNTVYLKTLSK